jgi:hypothetical protein
MLSFLVIIPSLFNTNVNGDYHVGIIRDFLLLALVTTLRHYKIHLPNTIFVSMGLYTMVCDILNNLTVRLLPKNKLLKNNWLHLQKVQIQEQLITLLELRNEYTRLKQ